MLLLPWHLATYLGDVNVTLPGGTVEIEGTPGTTGDPWRDLVGVYAPLAEEVGRREGPVVTLSGDCVASLAVLAGVQRRGMAPSLVWFDAHGDFHTEKTTTSGYLGGLPLAKVVGRGDLTLPDALGLVSLSEESVTLVDGRDLDPPESVALAQSDVSHVSVTRFDPSRLSQSPVVIHVDVDVIDPGQLNGLRFPAPGGPSLGDVVQAVSALTRARPIAALDIAATWRPEGTDRVQTDAVLSALLAIHL